jgi:hypothetical protein
VYTAVGVVRGLLIDIACASAEVCLFTVIFLSAYGHECDDVVFV